jgi:peptidoglycan L-alanyl-D-glutamate endopeptidase CwlK
MSRWILGERSKRNLSGVHPDLVKVVERALELSPVDFTVIEGLRTPERQAELMKQGFTRTLKSRHIIGQAVDIVPLPVDWKKPEPFLLVADAMKKAAAELGVKITWGGDWRTFRDLPHYQIEVGK